jgi:hypothetical protein
MNEEDFNAQDYPDGVEDDQYEVTGCREGEAEYDFDDRMDGDWDSAMASAGFGTDEDYGCTESY